MTERKKLGELLLGKGLIDDMQLRSAMSHQRNWGGKIGSALVELGFISTEDVEKVLEEQLRQKCLNERQMIPEPEAIALMNAQDAAKYVALPLRVRGNEVLIALSNPFDLAITDEIGFKLGKRVRGLLAVESVIKKSIKKYYGGSGGREYKVDIKQDGQEETAEIMHFDKGSFHTAMDVLETPFRYQDGLMIELESKGKAAGSPQPEEEPLSRALMYLLMGKGIITKEEIQILLNSLKNRPL
ncbi:MAG: GspE/PulE/PilB domain-containing protein [Nitrospirota bacterium]